MQRAPANFFAFITLLTGIHAIAAGNFGSSFGPAKLLPVEQAFTVSRPSADLVEIQIAEGTYIYDEHTKIQTFAEEIIETIRSEAIRYNDPIFGMTLIYRDKLKLHMKNAPNTVVVFYQGCSDIGFCYPPKQSELSFSH
ncbi:protein-disulfide reductase DsbD family protein [Litorivicinus sp.]|nr:protein-disulfide reductase DsbD family protein [Litorivicinus sp.]